MRMGRNHGKSATRTATVLTAIAAMVASFGLALGVAGPASAAPPPGATFPVTAQQCNGGDWAHFSGVAFASRHECKVWVQTYILQESCNPLALDDFQATGPTYAAQLGIPLGPFIASVCHGQDFPVINNSYAVDDPAGTDLVSLSSGNTAPFVTQPGHIYWIEVQGVWNNGPTRQADPSLISDDAWATWAEGPSFDERNLETQINGQFVDWSPYAAPFDPSHNYSYWVMGDGNPINMRVFDGNPATNTPNPAWYADNTSPYSNPGMPAIVFEYTLAAPQAAFPTTAQDCRRGGWSEFTGVSFRNQGQCLRWVRYYVVRQHCLPAALADFQATGPTYAAQLGIPLGRFIAAVCRGQDFPVINNSYAVDDPAGTELVSLASGNTAPFVTQPGHIYWIEVQGVWNNGPTRQADPSLISDDGWATWADGPSFDERNLETQVNGQFVDWSPYAAPFDPTHNYSYWIMGDGNPITMRVFDGNPATNTPNPAWYADNTSPYSNPGMPALVFEYALTTP